MDTYSPCSNANPSILGINCGNTYECEYDTLNYENEAICCSSVGGCQYSSATLTVNLSKTATVDDSYMIGIYVSLVC